MHVGHRFLHAASTSSAITGQLTASSPVGYDGQYYFAVAVDPIHARDYIASAMSPGLVYSRVLYPALARLGGLGTVDGVAYAMIAINVLSVLAGTLALAAWLRRRGVAGGYSLLYALFPGLLFCVFRDLTEPLAYGLVAVALYAFDRRSRGGVACAAALMGLAVLTRETTALFAAGMALSLVAADRSRKDGLRAYSRGALFLVTALLPLFGWRLAIRAWLGSATQERPGGGLGALVPFHAFASWWPWSGPQILVLLAVVVPTLLALATAALSWSAGCERLPIFLLTANALAFVVFVPAPVAVDYGAEGRAAVGVVLSLVYCFPMLIRRRRDFMAALLLFAWSPVWYVLAASLLGSPGPPLLS